MYVCVVSLGLRLLEYDRGLHLCCFPYRFPVIVTDRGLHVCLCCFPCGFPVSGWRLGIGAPLHVHVIVLYFWESREFIAVCNSLIYMFILRDACEEANRIEVYLPPCNGRKTLLHLCMFRTSAQLSHADLSLKCSMGASAWNSS